MSELSSLANSANFGAKLFGAFSVQPKRMAVIQPNDNRHCHRPNSVSQHFLLDRYESQVFIHRTVCSFVSHLPHISGTATKEQILLHRSSPP